MAKELKVGATVNIVKSGNDWSWLPNEYKAFEESNWRGEVIEFRDWTWSQFKWGVQSGTLVAWFRANELVVVAPETAP